MNEKAVKRKKKTQKQKQKLPQKKNVFYKLIWRCTAK